MADTSSLMKELNALVESRVFSAEAAEGIAKLRREVLTAQEGAEKQRGEIDGLRQQIAHLESQIAVKQAQVDAISRREQAVAEREKKVYDLEVGAAVSNAKASAYQDIVTKMFANRQVRESITENGYGPSTGGFSSSTSNSKTVMKAEE